MSQRVQARSARESPGDRDAAPPHTLVGSCSKCSALMHLLHLLRSYSDLIVTLRSSYFSYLWGTVAPHGLHERSSPAGHTIRPTAANTADLRCSGRVPPRPPTCRCLVAWPCRCC